MTRKRNVILWLCLVLIFSASFIFAQDVQAIRMVDVSKYSTVTEARVLTHEESQARAQAFQDRGQDRHLFGGGPTGTTTSNQSIGLIVDRGVQTGSTDMVFAATTTIPKGSPIIVRVDTDVLSITTVITLDYDLDSYNGFNLMPGPVGYWFARYFVNFQVSVPSLNPTAKVMSSSYPWGGHMEWRSAQISGVNQSWNKTPFENSALIQISGNFFDPGVGGYELMVWGRKIDQKALVGFSIVTLGNGTREGVLTVEAMNDEYLRGISPDNYLITLKSPDGWCDSQMFRLKRIQQ
ncbi:hypothetical protein D4R52_03410 [bacterium]|nr:MAG: hypothetical protein D4R52_03410 [bacterium]